MLKKIYVQIAGRTGAENSIIVTLIEVLNIITHIGCGWVADQPEVSVLVVNYIALMMAGLDTMIFPFYTEYWSFLVRKTMNRALPEYSENHDESKKRKMTFAEGSLLKSSDREEVKNRQ
uniref:Uncharacterized protein n=1 Tax=Caenorhabditis japonica TaxID=281687 RepID=A0A8R1I8V3_CAEJA